MWAQRTFQSPFVRAVNYHGIREDSLAQFERHLQFFQEHFSSTNLQDLLELCQGIWRSPRPGILITFDDGLRSQLAAASLLEKYGFVGWFMVPTGFIDAPLEQQRSFAEEHRILPSPPAGQRIALSWDELRALASRGHVIGCHTETHMRFGADIPMDILRREIGKSAERLREGLGTPTRVFAWVGGEESCYVPLAFRAIREAGFDVCFATNSASYRPGDDLLNVERTNIESDYDLPLLEFQLSGLMDVLYWGKRRRIRARARESPLMRMNP